jgi:hypothetical protein
MGYESFSLFISRPLSSSSSLTVAHSSHSDVGTVHVPRCHRSYVATRPFFSSASAANAVGSRTVSMMYGSACVLGSNQLDVHVYISVVFFLRELQVATVQSRVIFALR